MTKWYGEKREELEVVKINGKRVNCLRDGMKRKTSEEEVSEVGAKTEGRDETWRNLKVGTYVSIFVPMHACMHACMKGWRNVCMYAHMGMCMQAFIS